jgi:hypothetical protein
MKGGSRPSPSSFQLSFTGDPFCPHTIWASTNLMNWTLLGAAAPMTNGWFGFVDTNTPNWPRRFYRAAAPQ